MDKFLKLLLQKEGTVIIPDLGAIIVDNEDTGDLSFNEYIKYNDGKLNQIVEENSKVSAEEAQNLVTEFVKEISTKLDKGESYDVNELGSFSKSADGSVVFKGNIKGAKATEKKAPAKKEEATPKKEDKKEATKPADKASPEKSKKPEKPIEDTKKADKPLKEAPKKDEKATKPSKEDKIAAEKAKKAEKEKAAKAKADAKAEAKAKKLAKKKADKEAKAKLKNEKSKDPSKKKKKSFGVFFWMLMFILLVLCGGGVYVGMNYDKVKSYMGWDQFDEVDLTVEDTEEVDVDEAVVPDEEMDALESENSEEEEGIIEDEEDLEDEVVEEIEPVEEEVAPTPTPTVSSEGNIHLIAGTFSDKSNAESLVNDLQSKGHPAQIIGFFNNMHYVSVKSFSSVSDAKNGISSVESDAPGAWIYRQR